METITLNNGVKMPVLGLGTYGLSGSVCTDVIIKAFNIGFRSFDTASAYKNAEDIGNAFQQVDMKRDEIFITSKLSNRDQEKLNVVDALSNQLELIGLEFVDLYLMHWPYSEYFISNWRMMEEIYESGLARAIGVCNFHEHHLVKLLKHSNVVPAINQIEIHPLLNQNKLIHYCKSKNVQVEAYTPLARMDQVLMMNTTLCELANKYYKTVPQIILRWDIQNGVITIPKAAKEEHIKECIEIFDFNLTEEEMCEINQLNLDYRVRYNPDTVDMKKL